MRSVALISFLLFAVQFVQGTGNPVYRFIENQDIDALEHYLNDHDVNTVLKDSNTTLLVYAILQEKPRACRFLIENGADVNQNVRGMSPLMHASRLSNVSIVKQLIDASASTSGLDSSYNTPLFYAAAGGNVRICKALLKNGAPLNHRNKAWKNAYDYAILNGRHDAAQYLRKYFDNNPPDMLDGPYVKWGMLNGIHAAYLVHDSTKCITRIYRENFRSKTNPYVMQGFAGDSLDYTLFKTSEIPEDHFSGIEKILVVGDIHGSYDSLLKFLINNEVINRALEWTWGEGHIVLLGDIFDRGDRVTEALWLIYGLESQAIEAGGRVHYLLGNHEILILEQNQHYISDKYRLLTDRVNLNYYMFFSKRTLLGQWLRTRNTILRINEHLFVHAGLSPAIAFSGLDIHEINDLTRYFLNHPDRDQYRQIQRSLIMGPDGPFWYRGFIEGNHQYDQISENQFEKVLDTLDASTIFIGHTNVDHITPLFNARVFTLDVPFYTYGYSMEALLLQGSSIWVITSDGIRQKIR